MYIIFLIIHSILRWLVLGGLILAFLTALVGLWKGRNYSKLDNSLRAASVGFSHLQFIIGFILYFLLSPLSQSFLKNGQQGIYEIWFFGIYHFGLMFSAIVVLSIGSSIIKKSASDSAKFKNTLVYYGITLAIILLALPWFRPFFRGM
jgi:hypothetical protein